MITQTKTKPNTCAKCGAETINLVVCDSCNLPPEETKYYHFFSENWGECFFRVRGTGQEVLQIVTKTKAKRGSYKRGVYYIKYISFIGNRGWKLNSKLKESDSNIKEISKTAFDEVLEQVTNQFKDK